MRVFNLDTRLTVAGIADLRVGLLQALRSTPQLVLNFERVAEIDLSFVHVLYAARRQAIAEGRSLRFTGTLAPAVREVLAAAGVVAEAPTAARDLEEALLEFPEPSSDPAPGKGGL